MKFKIHHDPSKKTLVIPRAALQLSELTDAEELTIHTEPGCVLLLRDDMTAAESLKTIRLLSALNTALIYQLVQASLVAADMAEDGECEDYGCECCAGLAMPAELLEQAGIDPGSALCVDVEDGKIVISSSDADTDDPLNELESDFLTMLLHSGVSLGGLRYLLRNEDGQDE